LWELFFSHEDTKQHKEYKKTKNLVALSGFVGFIFSHEDTKKHKEYNKTKNLVAFSGLVGKNHLTKSIHFSQKSRLS
jgi:hypothetical protein